MGTKSAAYAKSGVHRHHQLALRGIDAGPRGCRRNRTDLDPRAKVRPSRFDDVVQRWALVAQTRISSGLDSSAPASAAREAGGAGRGRCPRPASTMRASLRPVARSPWRHPLAATHQLSWGGFLGLVRSGRMIPSAATILVMNHARQLHLHPVQLSRRASAEKHGSEVRRAFGRGAAQR